MEYNELDGAKRPSMTPLASLWGLYAGLGLCFISVLQNFIIKSSHSGLNFSVGMINFGIMVLILMAGMKAYRNTSPNLPFSYGAAFKFGIYQTFFASIIITAFFALTIFVLKPNFIELLEDQSIRELQRMGFSDELIEQSMSMTKIFMTPSWLIGSTLFGSWLTGGIASLVAAAIAKKRQ